MSSTTEMDNLNGNKSAINDGDQESPSCSSSSSSWQYLPDPVFLQLTAYLSVQDVLQMSVTCRNWWEMSQDDYLWKRLFRRDFKVSPSIGLRPGTYKISSRLHCVCQSATFEGVKVRGRALVVKEIQKKHKSTKCN